MINFYAHWRENLDTWAGPDEILAYWPTRGPGPSAKFGDLVEGLKNWPGSARYFRFRIIPDELGPPGHYILFAGNVYAMEDSPALACLGLDAIDAINRGNLDIVYFFVHGTFDHWSFEDFQLTLYDRLRTMKITRPGSVKIVISTRFADTVPNPIVRWIYHPWPGGVMQHQAKKFCLSGPPPIKDPRHKSSKFLCLNNRITDHRFFMLKRLQYKSLCDHALITLDHSKTWSCHDFVRIDHAINDPQWQQWLSQNHGLELGQTIDSRDSMTGVDKGWLGTNLLYQQSGWELVQETHCDLGSGVYLSGNTWRSMIMGMPFLINGTRHSLQMLRDLGYKTFNGIIDESYDEEPDTMRRIAMITDQLQKISLDQIALDWDHLQHILHHNQQLAWNHRYLTSLHDQLLQ